MTFLSKDGDYPNCQLKRPIKNKPLLTDLRRGINIKIIKPVRPATR